VLRPLLASPVIALHYFAAHRFEHSPSVPLPSCGQLDTFQYTISSLYFLRDAASATILASLYPFAQTSSGPSRGENGTAPSSDPLPPTGPWNRDARNALLPGLLAANRGVSLLALTPIPGTLSGTHPAKPFICHSYVFLSVNSFACHSYGKTGGEGRSNQLPNIRAAAGDSHYFGVIATLTARWENCSVPETLPPVPVSNTMSGRRLGFRPSTERAIWPQ
jgi:hypothetical protein